MGYRAVIFDLDGTLLNTLQDIAESVNKILDDFGFPVHDVPSYKLFVGEGMDVLVSRALPQNSLDPAKASELVPLINEEYSKRWKNNTVPYEGIPELLDNLTSGGIRMSILSNKPHFLTEIMASSLLSRWSFDAVVGAMPSHPNKPDPAGALQIARKVNLPPADFLYLGDSGIDMLTATRAGMYPVGALWGFRSTDELTGNGAKRLIKRPGELLEIIVLT